MDVRSDQTYSLLNNGTSTTYAPLNGNVTVDVAIIGAGISGALIAHALAPYRSCAVIDKRRAGNGSTAASTSLLQYEIDTPLRELMHMVGWSAALRSYQLCLAAITELGELCSALGVPFAMRPSLQYASKPEHRPWLHEEYTLRRENGFEVQWLDTGALRSLYGIDAPGAILSAAGATVDAYQLTHALLEQVVRRGHHVYEHTAVTSIQDGPLTLLHTACGHTVEAKHVVIACGYESLQYVGMPVARLHTTYALATTQMASQPLWHRDSLIWETQQPYCYCRTTADGRILAGGYDDAYYNPELLEHEVAGKAKQIAAWLTGLFPELAITPEIAWGGVFATTPDGLPYIGRLPDMPNRYFALGFGGNGITFSQVAAQLVCDAITGRNNKDGELFSFSRRWP